VKEGDVSSKFFHKMASGRRHRCFVKEIEDENEQMIRNIENISEVVTQYFKDVYTEEYFDRPFIQGLD